MARNGCTKQCSSSSTVFIRSLLLLLALVSSAAHAQGAAGAGLDSSSTRRLLQDALLPGSDKQPASQQQLSNSSSAADSCWGWKSTQCLASGTDKPIFALLGDSITHFGFKSYGWASMLEAAYGGSVTAVNYGIEGATTRKVDLLVDKVMQQLEPHLQRVKLVTICFGANDAVKAHAPTWHLPVPKYKENLQHLVSRLREKGLSRIVLITPPPVGKRGDRDNALTVNYATAVLELAKELQLEAVDVFNPIMAVNNWQDEALETDALHLSAIGQKVFFNSVVQLLANSTDLRPTALPAQQPADTAQQQQPVALEVQTPEAQQQQQPSPEQRQSEQQKQPEKQQQEPTQQQGGSTWFEGGKAMSNVLCILLVLVFLAIVTEAKQVAQNRVSGEAAGRKVAP